MMVRLSIIIPAYNEEKRIGKTLEDYSSFFENKLKGKYEILVVLNGCRDNTIGVVKEYASKNKSIRFKDFKEAIGKGGAIIEGFKLVNGDLIGFVDADNATKAKEFYRLMDMVNDVDGVVGSRWSRGAKINYLQPLRRRIASRIFNLLVRILFRIGIRDTQAGIKIFKKRVVKNIVNELGTTKWAFDIDLLYRIKKHGYNIKEVPTVWDDMEGSKLKIGKTSWEMFLAVSRLRLIYSPFKFIVRGYDKVFGHG